MRRVVITGLGLLTSIGNDYENSWNNLINGKSGIKKINQFELTHQWTKIHIYYLLIFF